MIRFLARWFFPPAMDQCFLCGHYRIVHMWDPLEELAWCVECSAEEIAIIIGAKPRRLRVVGRRAG